MRYLWIGMSCLFSLYASEEGIERKRSPKVVTFTELFERSDIPGAPERRQVFEKSASKAFVLHEGQKSSGRERAGRQKHNRPDVFLEDLFSSKAADEVTQPSDSPSNLEDDWEEEA